MTTQCPPAVLNDRLAKLFAPIATELATAESRLRSELQHREPFINELAQHSFRMSGKRLRPALLLLSASACGEVNEAHRTLAPVVEMVHTATLVHDDILDEAVVRRHADTVNARWDNQTSVLLGDYLFTHAFYLASSLDTPLGCRIIGRATNRVCEGELLQTASSGDFHLSRDSYLHIIDAKTAALCACACELGAQFADVDNKTVAAFEAYGTNLGIAFQIADDLLDIVGEEQAAGKSLGTDLTHCKMTLPLIELRDRLAPSERNELQTLCEQPTQENLVRIRDWLEDSGSLARARQTAIDYAGQAVEQIKDLCPSTGDNGTAQRHQAHQSLVELANFVINRSA
ncbi:polyprenyl synthetase family protein [Adhaeretor mobilis]|uniref:Octaprenyl-diphosphate synthase n=1 Tax=Adhaeretor mobilis TaxID=1930276 RepID=A0A517MSJ4_9BACT|nr:polyprenyl synthetase family protein [Adhaeretor mobilis]QDS97767.1 Octaprenyl-diphosphate synthase [Adhaeretor mobilis]